MGNYLLACSPYTDACKEYRVVITKERAIQLGNRYLRLQQKGYKESCASYIVYEIGLDGKCREVISK